MIQQASVAARHDAHVVPSEHGFLERLIWLPFLRWFDRRVRRAVDGSVVVQSVDQLRVTVETLARQLEAVHAQAHEAEHAAAVRSSALDNRVQAGVADLLYMIHAIVTETAQRETELRLREDVMQLRVAALADMTREKASVLETAVRNARAAVAVLGTDLARSHAVMVVLGEDVAGCRGAIGTLDAEVATGHAAIAALDTRMVDGDAVLQGLGADLAKANAAITALGASVTEGVAVIEARLDLDRAATDRRLSQAAVLAQNIRGDVGEVLGGMAAATARLNHVFANTEHGLQRFFVTFDDAIAVRADIGYLLVSKTDVTLALSLIEAHGALERGTLQVILRLLGEGDTMIDVGANVGTMAIAAAKIVGATGRVIALEPIPHVADLLARSAVLNGVDGWLSVTCGAAGAADGTTDFGVLDNSPMSGSLVSADAQIIRVPVHRLDTLVAPDTAVKLVKIDVEGSELAVLAGMPALIRRNPHMHIIAEFAPSHLGKTGVSTAEWVAAFTAFGHEGYEIDEADGRIVPLRTSGLDDVLSMNILFSRDTPDLSGARAAA